KGFYATNSREPFELRQRADIGRGGADIKCIIAMHPAFGAGELVLYGGAAGGGGRRVRDLEHAGDAAQNGGKAASLQSFLMLVPRLAEMHLAVDGARQD